MKTATSAALFLSLLGGCSEEVWDPPPIAYETSRIRIGLDGSFAQYELCPADLDRLDRRVDFVEARLGVRRDVPITLYMVDPEDWGPPLCSEGAMGCYFKKEDEAFASYWHAVEHEMVHAVTRDIPFPSLFWNEGTAEMLSGGRTQKDLNFTLRPEGLEANELANYRTAAHFSRYLVETRGWEKFARAIRGDALDEVYGESPEMLTAAYEQEAPFAYPPFEPCPHPWLQQINDEEWTEALRLSCDDPAATGMNQHPRVAVRRSFELQAGTYAFRFRNGVGFSVIGCHTDVLHDEPEPPSNGDVPNEIDLVWSEGREFLPTGVQVLDLTDGTYRIAAYGSHNAEFEAELSIRRVDWSFDKNSAPQREPD